MPRKIRDLLRDLKEAGFFEMKGSGKGSHRKFIHANFRGIVTISGKDGDDVMHYQEKQVRLAIESTKQ